MSIRNELDSGVAYSETHQQRFEEAQTLLRTVEKELTDTVARDEASGKADPQILAEKKAELMKLSRQLEDIEAKFGLIDYDRKEIEKLEQEKADTQKEYNKLGYKIKLLEKKVVKPQPSLADTQAKKSEPVKEEEKAERPTLHN